MAIILLTQNGLNSNFVQQEIGFIKAQNIPFVQVIELGLEGGIKGFNYGRDYVLLDPSDSNKALEKVKKILINFWNRKNEELIQRQIAFIQANENRRRLDEINRIEERRKQDEANVKLLVGGLAALLILGLVTSQS